MSKRTAAAKHACVASSVSLTLPVAVGGAGEGGAVLGDVGVVA